MKLPPEGARWLVAVRWLACAGVFAVVGLTSTVLGIVRDPAPLYGIACAMVGYNVLFRLSQRNWAAGKRDVERNIFAQILLDLVALTLLVYFSDMPRNPFLFFFVFHMIIASMYLPGAIPYLVAELATALVGAILVLEYAEWIPSYPIRFPSDPPGVRPLDWQDLLGVFVAFSGTVGITVYFTKAVRRYVDWAHAEIRQKEKMLGIGQLVAGIAHQIANPLDGMQNCLRRIGHEVRQDARLTEYVQLMTEALERIERTATRVQAFARPRGITLQSTDVNRAVEGTLQVLGAGRANIRIETRLGDVPPVEGDPYTLQEVLFNLCTNGLAAMPGGGTLSLHTLVLDRSDENDMLSVAIEVTDTGVGIPRLNLEKIFEPFFTTRGDSGGTGLGLGLCRMLIYEMGGRIAVRSVLNHGTTFTVMLKPADTRTAAPAEEIT